MRPIERIPVVMNLMFNLHTENNNSPHIPLNIFLQNDNSRISRFNLIYLERFNVMYYWIQNPDQRFGQVLFNLGLSDDSMYNVEEDDWLISKKYCKVEDIKFWTSYLDENNQRLTVPRKKLLKDLDIDHIRNIIKFFEDRDNLTKMDGKYLEYFDERIYDDEHSN